MKMIAIISFCLSLLTTSVFAQTKKNFIKFAKDVMTDSLMEKIDSGLVLIQYIPREEYREMNGLIVLVNGNPRLFTTEFIFDEYMKNNKIQLRQNGGVGENTLLVKTHKYKEKDVKRYPLGDHSGINARIVSIQIPKNKINHKVYDVIKLPVLRDIEVNPGEQLIVSYYHVAPGLRYKIEQYYEAAYNSECDLELFPNMMSKQMSEDYCLTLFFKDDSGKTPTSEGGVIFDLRGNVAGFIDYSFYRRQAVIMSPKLWLPKFHQ